MKNQDYVPSNDLEFDAWQTNLVTKVVAGATAWGIPADDVTALQAEQTAWKTAFTKGGNLENRSTADVRAKDDEREKYERMLRGFVSQWLSFNKKVTNSDRESMGLTVRTGIRTKFGIPESVPVLKINFSVSQKHTIYFADGLSGGKAKPDGVYGCEIWIKIGGEAPKGDSDFTFLAIDTRSSFVVTFPKTDCGKTAWYRVRWINTRGQQGSWSDVVSAIIN